MNNIIKIIDEHEINREAKIITYISLDGNDYAVYTISRDEEMQIFLFQRLLILLLLI